MRAFLVVVLLAGCSGGTATTTPPDAAPPQPDATPPAPGIDVSVDGQSGDVQFGVVPVSGRAYVRTFAIHNPGAAPLQLDAIAVGGANASDFRIVVSPPASIPAGGHGLFQIGFAPGDSGARAATLSIPTNVPTQPVFSVTLAGIGGTSSIVLTGRGHRIRLGAAPASFTGTDFGSAGEGAAPIIRQFTLRNRGSQPLTLMSIGISGPAAADFSVSAAPATNIPGGGMTRFAVTFRRGGTGKRAATVTLVSNEPVAPRYAFAVAARGVSGAGREVGLVESSPPPG